MEPRIVRSRDLMRVPWKNGGGATMELAAEPAGVGIEAFDWRVSVADVASDGPFSVFPGVDRTLALIEGAMIDIEVDGLRHRLDASSPLLSFSGEARTGARLPSGPIRDLNVMTRRARLTHRMIFVEGCDGDMEPEGSILVLVVLRDAGSVTLDGQNHRLDRLDAVIAEPPPREVVASAPLIRISLTRL